jgi:hypothetical protein
MAKVSAHGQIIGTIEFTTTAKRYMSDGVVLKNFGTGWKIHGKVKDGFTPQEAYEKAINRQNEARKTHPANFAYRKELHDLAPITKRWKLHTAVEMMPDDPDGVWSECCDGYCDNVSADIEDVVKLCMLYRNAVKENIEKMGSLLNA